MFWIFTQVDEDEIESKLSYILKSFLLYLEFGKYQKQFFLPSKKWIKYVNI